MFQAVQGRYRAGRVELDEMPSGIDASRIVVLFLPEESPLPESGQSRQAAVARVLSQIAQGLNLGGPPYPRREELYDRA
jgi:hypothetical protein